MEEVAKNGLVVLLKENNIEESTALSLSSSFDEFYKQANEWKAKATEFLNNPELSDEEKVKESRTARLALVKVRTSIEKKRKELNEEDQQKIADRNSAAKVLTALVTPTETLLLEKEKEAEIADNKRKELLKEARETALKNYNVDCQFFDLANMPDEAFKILLDNSALAFRAKAEEAEREEKRKAMEAILIGRITQLINLGFTTKNECDYTCELCDVDGEEIQGMTVEQWDRHIKKITEELDKIKKEKEAEERREQLRLLAEKEELERKNQLLQQQEKERQQKHNASVYRQQAAARMNIVLSYEEAAEMTEPGWTEWFNAKNSEYEAEQNRLFIEKKKKERDEAIAKAAEEIKERRIAELKTLGFEHNEVHNTYTREGFGFVYPVQNYDTEKIKKEIEAKRAAELAPDKEKISLWLRTNIVHGDIEMYHSDLSEDAKKVASEIYAKFNGFKKWAEGEIEKLK
jgi:hypothetical protein